jgi:cysteine-rich repeat protein
MDMADASQSGRGINLFYLILAIMFGLAGLFSFAVWWPTESPAPVGVVDAPTVITQQPEEHILAIQTNETGSTTLPIAQSTSTVFALIMGNGASTTAAKRPTTTVAKTAGVPKVPSTDRISPTTPGGLIVRSVSYNQVVISWNPSTDNRGVAGYAIYQDSALIGTTVKTLQGFIRLSPSKKYTFGVAAFDSAGNSSSINNILVTTSAKPVPVAVAPTPAPVAETPAPAPATVLPPSLCGNGQQDRGEECDDGNQNDNDMCTNQCKAARCTDGIVNYVLEQCDDGNEYANDYCDNQCHNHVPTLPDGTTLPPAPTPSPAPSPTPSPTPPTPPPAGSFALTTTVSGSGSVSSSPAGISCGATCSANYVSGTSVTLTETPTAGATFTGWSGACTGTASTCTVSMTAARSVTATFSVVSYALSVTKGGSGTITSSPAGINCGATCNANYNSGTSVTLTESPGSGYVFSGWSGACSGSGTTCTVSMSAARSVTATFAVSSSNPVTYTVNVTSAGNYSLTSLTLNVGDSIKFVYTPPISGEVVTRFTPSTVSSVTLDSEFTNRTRTFTAVGTWTFKAADHNGNTGTVTVQ